MSAMMPGFQFPLSNDTNVQSIEPFATFFKLMGSQLGFINIDLGRSSDPALEQRIVKQVGTYGKQLGTIGDVLRILLKQVERAGLSPEEEKAVRKLEVQLDGVDETKARFAHCRSTRP